ncbi:MAG: sulfotransferase domain-containing protein [Actinomycetota bacterium]|nr:sulfotransferase domain-containing protein [Actinomycetota bacterium]
MTQGQRQATSALDERLRPVFVEAGRSGLRAVGMATARWRPAPDFLIIGTKRGGTTSLHSALSTHPQVLSLFPPGRVPLKRTDTKGVHHFAPGTPRSTTWYRSHFPLEVTRRRASSPGHRAVAGEASPYYLFHPGAAARAAEAVPNVKVIALLRDPVERSFSHYREQKRNGVETLTFEQALDAEQGRLADDEQRLADGPSFVSFAHEHQSYRAQSEYAYSLERWLRHYPREQVLVLVSEDFYTQPQAALDRVFTFLGLRPHVLPDMPVLNAAPAAPLSADLRKRLRRHFDPDVAHLEELLGWSPPWPDH